jgi:MFS-type transporter involved in bile tolerance (Atg22 family)
VGAALVFVHNFLLSNGAEVMGNSGAGFAGMIVVIALGLYWYARTMRRRGLLG